MPDIQHENEAHEKLKEFIEKEFKNFNYTIIVGLSRVEEGENGKNIYSLGFTLTNTNVFTPIGIMKGIYANIMAQYQNVMNKYDIDPAKPLFQEKGERNDE